ncbi:hypothetical protein INT43_001489 [Umbelopsis isabellina]|uniref:Protein transport protein SFT2 n=1 Tax=Mortierella isabellina TaxID=91625 RepID=A0A8H7U8H4_MORIS|nr:hypothetical protein INT43_001489 [Umbelopsis isabellina]
MSSSAESNFRNSLRGFNSTPRSGGIQLPTTGNQEGSALGRTWASFTSGATDAFDNARRTVQGYVPVNAQEEVDEPWFQMSRWEVSYHISTMPSFMPRLTQYVPAIDGLCVMRGAWNSMFRHGELSFYGCQYWPSSPVNSLPLSHVSKPMLHGMGSILMLISVALLRGPWAHVKHMMSLERLPFTAAYLGTMGLTLYFSLGARNYILTIISAVLQIIALLWYFGSYIPGGVATLRYGSWMVGRQASSLLPF